MSNYVEFASHWVSRVRMNHTCEWCAEGITRGTRARYRRYIFDGRWLSGYMHPECYEGGYLEEDPMNLEDGWVPGDYKRGSAE